ncbi:hypothetical protein Tco_0917944 [Tanacetum coccineum]
MTCAQLRSSAISNLSVTRNSWSSYLARRVIVSCKADAILACWVSMSSPIDSICSGGGTDGGVDGEGDLDLLRDEDGKSDGGGEYDDVKSDGGDDNDGISDGGSG